MTQWGLDTLFNPAKRHMDEEKRRLQSTREEVGDNSGGKRIDLESGRVRIRREAEDEQPQQDGQAGRSRAGNAADAPGTAATSGSASSKRREREMTPAAQRAAERRRRRTTPGSTG